MDAATDLEIDADTRQRVDDLRREVLRDRDRFNAASLRLRFLSQPETHPFQGMLWNHRAAGMFESGWISPGSWLCGITLPTQNGDSFARYQVFIDDLNEEACSKLKQHGNEVAALLRRLGAEATKEQETQLFRELFEVHRLTNTLIWAVNEELGRPETRSCVATVPDVFQATATFLGALLDVSGLADPRSSSDSLPSEQAGSDKDNKKLGDADWIRDAGQSPPTDYAWGPLTGTKTHLGFAVREPTRPVPNQDKQLRNDLMRAAQAKNPRVWLRWSMTAKQLDCYFRTPEWLHKAQEQFDGFPNRKAVKPDVGDDGSVR